MVLVSETIVVTALLMGLATAAVRFLPFLVGARFAGATLRRLFAELFPPAVLAVLIVYLSWDVVAEASPPVQVAQAAGVLVTVAAHLGFRNLLLSVGSGTAVCMVVQNFWPL